MIYSAGKIQIYIPDLRCGSVVSIVKIGKQSLFAFTHFSILTRKIYLPM